MESGQDYCKVGLIIYIRVLCFSFFFCTCVSSCLFVWLPVHLPFQKERITEEVLELHAFILSVHRMLLPAACCCCCFFPTFQLFGCFSFCFSFTRILLSNIKMDMDLHEFLGKKNGSRRERSRVSMWMYACGECMWIE